MIFSSKRGISVILATILILLVAVIGGNTIFTWFNQVSSDWEVKMESSDSGNLKIMGIKKYGDEQSAIGIRNLGNSYHIIDKITLNGNECNLVSSNVIEEVETIYLNCSVIEGNIYNIEIMTDKGIFSKTQTILEELSDNIIYSGSFSGYAYGENVGFINFNGDNYQVIVINNQLSGYAYGENVGFISFNGSNYQVTISGGTLIGYAYGENIGFIRFDNSPIYSVTFDGNKLSGYAYGENIGFIRFDNSPLYQVSFN